MDERLAALRDRLAAANDIDVLRHVLGLERLDRIPDIADTIVDDMIVICLDCEHWSNNTEEMTEVGVVQFTMADMGTVSQSQDGEPDLGDHGENMLKLVKFNPLRIKETSHLVSSYEFTKGAAGNRFGEWRFASFAEARDIMCKVFAQSMSGLDCDHPVVLLGHDVGHDKSNLKNRQLQFDLEALGTVVRTIDTQKIVKEVRCWHHSSDNIGLDRLVGELWFEHSDPHTAANDAARTLISAIQLALRNHPCKGKSTTKTMQQVADTIESQSKSSFLSLGGDLVYCCKCSSRLHLHTACTADNLDCAVCLSKGRIKESRTHVAAHCPAAAEDRSLARRERERLERPAKNKKKAERRAEAARRKRMEPLQLHGSSTQGPIGTPQPSQVTYSVQYVTQYNYGPHSTPGNNKGPPGNSMSSYGAPHNFLSSSAPSQGDQPPPPPQGFSQPHAQNNLNMGPLQHPCFRGDYGGLYAGSAYPRLGFASGSCGRGGNAGPRSGRGGRHDGSNWGSGN